MKDYTKPELGMKDYTKARVRNEGLHQARVLQSPTLFLTCLLLLYTTHITHAMQC